MGHQQCSDQIEWCEAAVVPLVNACTQAEPLRIASIAELLLKASLSIAIT